MKKVLLVFLVIISFSSNADGQFLGKLGKLIGNAAKGTVEQKQKEVVDKILDAKIESDNAKYEEQKSNKVVYDFIPMTEDSITFVEPLINEKATVADVQSYMPEGYDTESSDKYKYYYENGLMYIYNFVNRKLFNCIVTVVNVNYDACVAWFDSHYKRKKHEESRLSDTYEYSTKQRNISISVMFMETNDNTMATISYTFEP